MNKENNNSDVKNISSALDELNISTKNRRVTRSASRLQPKIKESVNKIKDNDNVVSKKIQNDKKLVIKKLKNVSEIESEIFSNEIENIVGREVEKSTITNFLVTRFESGSNANLYISGSPGTGKTAVVTSVLESLKLQKKCYFHMTTCMDFSQATGVFSDLWKKLSGHEESNSVKAASEVENYIQRRGKAERPIVIVLDEVDQLTSTNQRILYKIFKWVELASCRLIIIGIANTLDLTETKLPDLILESYRPHHINFPPYSESELKAIILSRVKVQLTPAEQLAVTLCSKKVSGKSGDARVALELYKRAGVISEGDQLSTLGAEISETVSEDAHGFRTPLKKQMRTPQLLSLRRSEFVTPSSPSIKHVSRAITEVEKISQPYRHMVDADTGKSNLPLHHKLVLCSALVLAKEKTTKTMNLAQLSAVYGRVCNSQDMAPLDMSELVNICELLDARALMRVRPHKEVRQRTFTLNLDQDGIESALADHALITSILAKFCP